MNVHGEVKKTEICRSKSSDSEGRKDRQAGTHTYTGGERGRKVRGQSVEAEQEIGKRRKKEDRWVRKKT